MKWLVFLAECRPCSVKETLELFCSSDFVARGSISSIYNDIQLERTLMTVRASRVIRQASSVFTSHASADAPARWSRRKRKLIAAPSKWKGMDGVEEDLSDPAQDHVATLHVPLSCKVKIGGGQFVFMGRKRLGDAVLFCAPRLEEWQQWIVQANIDGTAQCRLESWYHMQIFFSLKNWYASSLNSSKILLSYLKIACLSLLLPNVPIFLHKERRISLILFQVIVQSRFQSTLCFYIIFLCSSAVYLLRVWCVLSLGFT